MSPPPATANSVSEAARNRRRSGTRRLTALYIFALSTVAVLSIGAHWLVQRQLDNGDSDSRVINLAGRQRMLSQRIAKAAFGLHGADAGNAAELRGELAKTLEEWSNGHRGLQQGDPRLGLPGGNSRAVAGLFRRIEPHYRALASAAGRLVDPAGTGGVPPDAVAAIRRHEGPFLEGMDAVVSQYVAEAEQRVANLRRLELAVLGLTLLVLLAEGLLIFRPAVQRIERSVDRLRAAGDRLRRARDEAEHGNAAKTRFLANVSHELRTPMTAVLGMTALARETDDPVERDGCLQLAEEAGESLLGLLNDLIDTARIDAGRIELTTAAFDPQAVVERVARMMRLAGEKRGLPVVVAKPPQPLPRVEGDARRIEQVLVNLIGNSVKWTQEGSVTVGCEAVRLTSSGARLRFRVQDTGVGIHPADQRRVFEPFTQLPGARDAGRGGAGLGLAICRRIAAAMDARLELSSTPGAGTTVTLTGDFPAAGEPQSPAEPAEASLPPGEEAVLVVEDTEVNQLLLRRLLEREGCRVEVVGSGEEAVERYRSQPYGLVLIDLQLPGIDGAETAEQVRAIDAGLGRATPPLVCLTAHTSPAAVASSRFNAVLTKPIRGDSLVRTLAGLLTGGGEPPVVPLKTDGVQQAGGPQKISGPLRSQAPPHGPNPKAGAGPGADADFDEQLDLELAAAFLEIADHQAQDFATSLAQPNPKQAGVLAHRFRGQLGYFGCDAARAKLGEVERACDRGQPPPAALADEAVAELKRAIGQLRKRMGPQAPSGSGAGPARE